MINISAIVIVASGVELLLFSEKEVVNEQNFSKIILPIALGCFGASYLLDFFQFANPYFFNTPIALLSLGVALVVIFLFYSFEKVHFIIPGLSALGMNMFFFFLFSPIFGWLLVDLLEPFTNNNPWLTILVFGIVPLLILFLIAFLLKKKQILWKI
jgi:hypothetical protein